MKDFDYNVINGAKYTDKEIKLVWLGITLATLGMEELNWIKREQAQKFPPMIRQAIDLSVKGLSFSAEAAAKEMQDETDVYCGNVVSIRESFAKQFGKGGLLNSKIDEDMGYSSNKSESLDDTIALLFSSREPDTSKMDAKEKEMYAYCKQVQQFIDPDCKLGIKGKVDLFKAMLNMTPDKRKELGQLIDSNKGLVSNTNKTSDADFFVG